MNEKLKKFANNNNIDSEEEEEEENKNENLKSYIINEDGLYVDPYLVKNETGGMIDYCKILNKFGCKPITFTHLQKIETISGNTPLHCFLKRGFFYAQRDLDYILNHFENTKPFYLYTGRGPSAGAMHLGHLIPFIFCKYLQDIFKVPIVIQITDDEKYFFKSEFEIEKYSEMGIENIKDIIACGFDPERTFIFLDTDIMSGSFYKNVVKIQKTMTIKMVKKKFGLAEDKNCGIIAYPAIQAAPALSSSFPEIFDQKTKLPCLIPSGIDQDPYFRLARMVCEKLKLPKCCCLYSKFFPALQGVHSKMNSSDPNSAIYLTDTPLEIQTKINEHAFSKVKEEGQTESDLIQDVCFLYMTFFEKDDKLISSIKDKYCKGELKCDELKKMCTNTIQNIISEHQSNKKNVTNEIVQVFMTKRKLKIYQAGENNYFRLNQKNY